MVAYYCPEPLSTAAERLLRSATEIGVSDLTEVEVLSAIARKARAGELPVSEAGRAITEFLVHLDGGFFARLAVERSHYRLARDWLAHRAIPLPALDTLHLAVAASNQLRLVTADRAMARAAESVGVEVVLLG